MLYAFVWTKKQLSEVLFSKKPRHIPLQATGAKQKKE